ncbi:MAG: hypothetical protein JAZ03_22035 [Candidatus Thiodiazotropha taylori]|nr:hypothetical protein [Candidatus Thiodiazotropha taylori]MCW4336609.1 reverse transcriptase domain-containing protein [Candidatus Thiodiazotropha endolucinida]
MPKSTHGLSDSSNFNDLHASDVLANSSMRSQVSHNVFNSLHSSSIPESSFNTANLGLRGKGLRIGHINIQGLGNKFDEIKIMLQSNSNKIHILGLSETKLSDLHPDSVFEVNEFQKPFRKDRGSNGGGLLVYVKTGISCIRRYDLEHDSLECIWLEVKPTNSKPFLVAYVYRPPKSTIQWNDYFEESLEKACSLELEMYLLGDFNRDLLNDQVGKSWLDYTETFGITQYVREATRVTNSSKTLIDHIYSNFSENITFVDVPKIGLSDHFPIFFTRKMNSVLPKTEHHTITYRSFKNFDENKFISDLQSVPWEIIQIFDHPDDILQAWTDLFLEIVDAHVPIRQHRVKYKNQPKWLTPEILDAIKIRDRYKALGHENSYKIWRNKVTRMIRQSKKEKYETFIDENKNKPGSIFKIFQEAGAGKGQQAQTNIGPIKYGDLYIEQPTDIANSFNEFFVNVASKIKEPLLSSNHDRLREFCNSKLLTESKYHIPPVQKDQVKKFLHNLDVSKATGTDNIGPRLLKLSAPYIANEITYICNQSVGTSIFPEKWKEAKVTPLFKKGSSEDMNNYRPISILPTLSKILEKHVHDSLMHHLNTHELLHKMQSGFRPKHSCETALISMVDSWLNALDNGKVVGVLFIDFKKAFDLVDHEILLTKLKLYGISEETSTWFKTYLTHRQQQTSLHNVNSELKTVTYGVPQGSILGPLLFLLFINDLPLYIKDIHAELYADDTTLFDIQGSTSDIEKNLQQALNKLSMWCKYNGMVVNTEKTKLMLITTSQRRQRMENEGLSLKYTNDALGTVGHEKVLGVFVDHNLSWSEHVKYLSKKIRSSIWLLSKIKNFLSLSHRVQYYKSYIQPHIDFCNIVWGNTSESNKTKIFRLQKRACRVILDYNIENTAEAMSTLGIMSVFDRIFFRKAKLMFKVYNGLAPTYISEHFELRQATENIPSLRSSTSGCFIPPKPKKELFKQSMRYSGCLIWNSLPDNIKQSQSVESFHRKCIKWLTGD